MSYTIEYDGRIFVAPKKNADPNELILAGQDRDLLRFVRKGCNNVQPRPKDWVLSAQGWPYAIVRSVCADAGDTEGGCLQYSNGKWTTPETYIKRWRSKMAEGSTTVLDIAGLASMGIYAYTITLPEDWRYKLEQHCSGATFYLPIMDRILADKETMWQSHKNEMMRWQVYTAPIGRDMVRWFEYMELMQVVSAFDSRSYSGFQAIEN